MSIVMNGTTIPTEEGCIKFNGTTIKKVICNGTTVWEIPTFTSQTFNYTGAVQTFTVPVTGTYKLEVWGAQGGNAKNFTDGTEYSGGKGGYSYGNKELTQGTVLYIYVGQQGVKGSSTARFNGGGLGRAEGSSGGGATHIATSKRGELKSYKSYVSELLIVAGGGGGAGSGYVSTKPTGGAGGGTTGGNGNPTRSGDPGYGTAGSQSSGGTLKTESTEINSCYTGGFGYGGYPAYETEGGSGGGGYYGGGAAGNYNGGPGGGGGSGYIGGVINGSMSKGQRSGNGQAKITLL